MHILPGALGAIQTFAVGLAIVAGTVGSYYYEVDRPKAWPKASAIALSSTVVTATTEAALFAPQIRFQFEQRGISRHTWALSC